MALRRGDRTLSDPLDHLAAHQLLLGPRATLNGAWLQRWPVAQASYLIRIGSKTNPTAWLPSALFMDYDSNMNEKRRNDLNSQRDAIHPKLPRMSLHFSCWFRP